VFSREALLGTLDDLADDARAETDDEGEEEPDLEDLGDALLPRLVAGGDAAAYPLPGYWRDVGTVDSFWQGHMDLLAPEPPIRLDDPDWPVLSRPSSRLPARVAGSARIVDSLISPGARVEGRVERSVLGPGVVVEQGAVVRDSVILSDTVVARGARVDCAVVDARVRCGEGAAVGAERGGDGTPDIAVVGMEVQIPAGVEVAAGEEVPAADR